jgi:hypothetical protein
MIAEKEAEIEFKFENHTDVIFKTKFLIIEQGLQGLAILGCEFLSKYKSILDFESEIIKIDDVKIQLPTNIIFLILIKQSSKKRNAFTIGFPNKFQKQ